MKRLGFLFFPLLCAGLLSACSGGVKETLGLNKKAPDEFKVLARPPLSVPPEFSLRPPADGAEGDSMLSPRDEAKSAVFNADKAGDAEPKARAGGSTAEARFLRNAGAENADSSAREEMNREAARQQREERGALDMLTTLPPKKDPVVDARGESQRLKQNKAGGKPVTEGETPDSQPADRGILGRIFGD